MRRWTGHRVKRPEIDCRRDTGRKRMVMRDLEGTECLDCLLSFCFYRWAYVLHGPRVAIAEHHRSSKPVRAMRPAFAGSNSVMIRPFSNACSSTAQG
jgi:hypothetical protein